jgi:prostaglandin-endoperoxide synthase 2
MLNSRILLLKLGARGRGFWRFVSSIPILRTLINRFAIHLITSSTKPRPLPLSLWAPEPGPCADYTSWTGLVDRTYTGRHLPPAPRDYVSSLPPPASLDKLFRRGRMTPCPKSSALFGFFAQWFTDSFLRTDPNDLRKNTSNHEIDLCQIYGLCTADTTIIRSKSGGELKMQMIDGQEYPPYLFEPDGRRVKEEFRHLSYINDDGTDYRNPLLRPPFDAPERKAKLFVTGLERGNSTIFYSAINTIFMREHNRLCRKMAERYHWDDDRLFETARNTNIAQLLKIIIEDYINHLASTYFKLFVEVGFAERKNWYRTNRIAAEFDLLYRWHPLVPNQLILGGRSFPHEDFRVNNEFLINHGLETVIDAAAKQSAGRIMLENTAPFLVDFDLEAIKKSRIWCIRPYNEYRSCFGLPPMKSFEELAGDGPLAVELKALYKDVDRVELLVGLLAEQGEASAPLGNLMTLMVGVDAFSQALTNPLLSKNVYGEQCFSEVGIESIAKTSSFEDIVRRNSDLGNRRATFERPRTVPGSYGPPILKPVFDTVDFVLVSGWEEFFRRRQRNYASTVFKANLFGKPIIVALDHRAIAPLFASDDLIQDYGFGWAVPPLPLVGNVPPGVFESGAAHDKPKELYLELLRKRSATLVPVFQEVADKFFDDWLSRNRFSFQEELENFAATLVFRWILGKNPEPKDVREVYNNIFTQLFTSITKHIPWSSYSRSLVIYPRLLAFVKSAPGFAEIATLARGVGLVDEDVVAKQILFVLGMNSFLGIQSMFKSIVGELSLRPELCAALREEIAAKLGAQPSQASISQLGELPMLDKTLREIFRLHPPVFFIYGRATRDRVLESDSGSFDVKNGELIMGVIPIAHSDPSVFDEPEAFDPNRFDVASASEHLIWPRGLHDANVSSHDRICPGKNVAVEIGKLFTIALLTRAKWRLKDPQPQWDRRRFSLNAAAPKGALDVESFRARPPAQPGDGPAS